jgi:hypothetical protein
MNNLPLSSWRTAYASAIFETDQNKISLRVADAVAAIEERLRVPTDIGPVEQKSIEAAQSALATLKVERVDRAIAAAANGNSSH